MKRSFFIWVFFHNHESQDCRKGGGHFFNSSLPIPPTSQRLRHQLGNYCREFISAHRQQPDLNRESLVSGCKLLTTKLCILKARLSPSKKSCVICFIESPSKMMKNAFSLILEAYFVLKIFKFLPSSSLQGEGGGGRGFQKSLCSCVCVCVGGGGGGG